MTEDIKAGQIIEYDKDNVPHFIINGVDVSDCGFLDYHRPTKLLLCEECNSDFAAMECKDDPNCYYKQLKRLETENAKLKESNESLLRQFSGRTLVRGTEALFDITTAEFNYQIQRLKEENKKLKEELNRYKEMETKGLEEFKDIGGCWGCGLQLQLEQNIKDLKKYGQENEKLKKALEEIRKLNSSCADCDCYNACGVCSNAEEKPYRSFKIADEVLKDE